MEDFVVKYIEITGQAKKVISDNESKYMHFVVPASLLVPNGKFSSGKVLFEDWAVSMLKN
ncbi:hypothetical protein [Chryseobacterium wanjuense]